jgi:NAD-dependent SIR2 family protein deacetylase
MIDRHQIERASRAIREAGPIVITAGAGMGVDSGLPDFRGDGGWWLQLYRSDRCEGKAP